MSSAPPQAATVYQYTHVVRDTSGVGERYKAAWVDIRTTQQVVPVGLRTILVQAVGPLDITIDGPHGRQHDVILYDVIKLNDGNGEDLDHLHEHSVSTIIAVDRTPKPALGTRARDKGVEWAVTLDITPDELVAVIHDPVSGNLEDDNNVAQEWDPNEFLGARGLSPVSPTYCNWSSWVTATRDRCQVVPQHQLGEDLHSLHLPQDRRDQPWTGHRVGHPARVPHREVRRDRRAASASSSEGTRSARCCGVFGSGMQQITSATTIRTANTHMPTPVPTEVNGMSRTPALKRRWGSPRPSTGQV